MRWHESYCSTPAVVNSGGVPACRNCLAVATDSAPALTPPGQNYATEQTDPPAIRHNLSWPKQVEYIHDNVLSGLSSTQSAEKAPSWLEKQEKNEAGPYETSLGAHQFRLLRLSGGNLSEPLHGEIIVVDFHKDHPTQNVKYECVSYTATNTAEDLPAATIYLGEFWDAIDIKASCAAALQQLRLEKSPRLLWVDSVCINQRDHTEKSHQLSIISPIFGRATQLVAHLGESTEAQRIVFDCLRKISSPDSPLFLGALETCTFAQRAAHDRALYFMREFFKHTRYFHRVWPALEFIVAQSVLLQSDRDTAPWPVSGLELGAGGLPSWTAYRGKRENLSEWDLLPLLRSLSPNGCTDPRDRLFCALMAVRSWDEEAVIPHYGLSTEEVYIGITSYLIQKQHALKDALSLAGKAQHRLSHAKLPSWVPDWDNLMSHTNWNYTSYTDYKTYVFGPPSSRKMHILRCRLESDAQSAPLQICSTSGALRVSAALQSRPPAWTIKADEGFQNSQFLILETTWRGASFTATWGLPVGETGMVQDGDKLAWVAGQFGVLRSCDEAGDGHPASFQLIHGLGRGLHLSCRPPALPAISLANNNGRDAGPDGNDPVEASLNDPLVHRLIAFDDSDNWDRDVDLQYRAMSHENQLRVITANANLQSRPGSDDDGLDPDGDGLASNDPEAPSKLHERYIAARDRLLGLALYIRLGWFDHETICWNHFVRAREAYRAQDPAGSRFLALDGSAVDTLEDHINEISRERICEWGVTLSLGAALGKMSLHSAFPAWSGLISALVEWTRAMERLLGYLSTEGEVLNEIWSSGARHDDRELPGSQISTRWVMQWQRYGGEGPGDETSQGGYEALLVLKHIIRLAKASTCQIPDYGNIGLGEIDRVMMARAAPLRAVSSMEWVRSLGNQLHNVGGFDADMTVRLVALPLGLELDEDKSVDII
ncbi:hypothetical protein N0V82_002177 [Gnomoniopsis sp. IMI 355080]|nr:hypothetical protein N0V82_002177 [Gnomoniopsis sp. IMI 355080]